MNKEKCLSPEQFTKHKKTLLAIIEQYLPHCTIYLFGSRARNTSRSGSDIDIALDAGRKIESRIMAKINSDIEESSIPFFVDVIDLQDVSEDFKTLAGKDFIIWKK